MVLIFTFLACMGTKTPQTTQPPTTVPTVITLASPEKGLRLPTPEAVVDSFRKGFSNKGLNIEQIGVTTPFEELGTRHHRTEWLLEQTQGSLVVMVETEARERSQLGGRYQWEITATVTIAESDSGVIVERLRLPTTLPHIHQGEEDALKAVGTRLADKTATLIERYRRSGS